MSLKLNKETLVALGQEETEDVNAGVLHTRHCHTRHCHTRHCHKSHKHHHCHTRRCSRYC